MIGFLEIVVFVFCLFAISRVILRLRDRQVSVREGIFWIALWLIVIVLVWLQNQIGLFSKYLAGRRPVDVIMYMSILLLFYLLFRLYVKLDAMNSEITKLVRQQSLSALGKRRR